MAFPKKISHGDFDRDIGQVVVRVPFLVGRLKPLLETTSHGDFDRDIGQVVVRVPFLATGSPIPGCDQQTAARIAHRCVEREPR
jgi:hypothetical protein